MGINSERIFKQFEETLVYNNSGNHRIKKFRETETVKFEIAFLKSKKAYKSMDMTHICSIVFIYSEYVLII